MSSGPGSGVPVTAVCHSALVGSRLRTFLQACTAWNQLTERDSDANGMLTAKTSLQPEPSSTQGA